MEHTKKTIIHDAAGIRHKTDTKPTQRRTVFVSVLCRMLAALVASEPPIHAAARRILWPPFVAKCGLRWIRWEVFWDGFRRY